MMKETDLSFEEYKHYILNLPIENYLSITVSKLNIERYKDKYVGLDYIQPMIYKNTIDIYYHIFAKTFQNYDL
jgi:hypothetical protein